MRTLSLVAALVAGAVLAGCSKPEPAAGAPTPDVVTVDSAKTTADSTATAAVPDSMKKDSTMLHDSTMNTMKDSATTVVPDSAAKP
jgi:ABC-type glycerol-3-phosphate transport system substrate-binding protein